MESSPTNRGQRVAYLRVSTPEQSLARQEQQVRESGPVDKIFTDHISGRSRAPRPGLTSCLDYLRSGDELVIASIDRLARSLVDLRHIVDDVVAKDAAITFLHERLQFSPTSSSDPRSNLMLGILGSFAEFERAIIRERQAEGIALARKAGKYPGRKRKLTTAQIQQVRSRLAAGESKAAIARQLGVARSTLYAALRREMPSQ